MAFYADPVPGLGGPSLEVSVCVQSEPVRGERNTRFT